MRIHRRATGLKAALHYRWLWAGREESRSWGSGAGSAQATSCPTSSQMSCLVCSTQIPYTWERRERGARKDGDTGVNVLSDSKRFPNTLDVVEHVCTRVCAVFPVRVRAWALFESCPLLGDTLEDLFLILVQTHSEGGVVATGDVYLVHLHLCDTQLLQSGVQSSLPCTSNQPEIHAAHTLGTCMPIAGCHAPALCIMYQTSAERCRSNKQACGYAFRL